MCPAKPLMIHFMIHLVRGVIGIALLIAAFLLAGSLPLAALLLGGGALVAFRGCPTCWLAGLFEVASTKKPAPHADALVHPPPGHSHTAVQELRP